MKKGPGRAGLIHEAFLSRDIYSCWWSIFPNNSLENRVQFPAKRNAFVLLFLFKIAAVTSRAKLAPVVQKLDIAIRGAKGGALIFHSAILIPLLRFFFQMLFALLVGTSKPLCNLHGG